MKVNIRKIVQIRHSNERFWPRRRVRSERDSDNVPLYSPVQCTDTCTITIYIYDNLKMLYESEYPENNTNSSLK